MEKDEESGSPSWSSLYIKQTTEDVARVVAAAASAAVHSPRSPRPSVVYSSKDDCGSPLNKLQNRVSRILKGLSTPPEVKSGPYNPEVLTSLKRQWAANYQLQSLDNRVWKDQSKVFESMVILGLPPSTEVGALKSLYFNRKVEGSGIFRSAQQARVEPNLEPQVLFVYPPEKQLPLKYKDLLSFCFPAGVEVNAVEKTPSMSELNEILLGQEHLKQSDQSFVFRLQVADESTLYGCCVMVEEIIQQPSGLISLMSDDQPSSSTLSRHILTTRRCYCILSRVPSFELHFGVLNSIFTEERLERLTKQVLSFELLEESFDECLEEETDSSNLEGESVILKNGPVETPQVSSSGSISVSVIDDTSHVEYQSVSSIICSEEEPKQNAVQVGPETEKVTSREESTIDTSSTQENNADEQLAGKLVILENGTVESPQVSTSNSFSVEVIDDASHVENKMLSGNNCSEEETNCNDVHVGPETEKVTLREESTTDTSTEENNANNQLESELVILNNGSGESPQVSKSASISVAVTDDTSHVANQFLNGNNDSDEVHNNNDVQIIGPVTEKVTSHEESTIDTSTNEKNANNQLVDELVIIKNGTAESPQGSLIDSTSVAVIDDMSLVMNQKLSVSICSEEEPNCKAVQVGLESEKVNSCEESAIDASTKENNANNQLAISHLPNGVLPLLRYQPGESSESSTSFQGSPSEDRRFRSDVDERETEETSSSGRDIFSEQSDIFEWAKANSHGSLQIICEYYRLTCPARGSTINFHPLDHLHPLEYQRPDERILHIAGSTIDLRSCNTSLEFTEAHNALTVEEEASALSVWAIACLCGSLRLEHVLTLFTGILLEKQIVVICSNLGILSALVLSIIPLIRPYQWQSLLMPVLPNDMLDFLDAPVPFIAGVKNNTAEVQSKLMKNYILVDANRNQVKSPSLPQIPQYRELHSCLIPYHAKLVGESYLGKKRPVYEYTEAQVEGAKGFLGVLRSYLDSLCSNLRSHTITNVQSNDDKVSLLLKESFIESFPNRDRPFMKQFLDTQLFSVHTDFVLSFFQKE